MRFLLTAVLFAGQTFVPIPRQTANRPAHATQNVKAQADADKKPAAPAVPVLNTNISPATETNSKTQDPKDAQQTIRITELPAVSVKDNGIDWRLWVFNGLLVIVGFLQVGLLLGTLRAIKRQAGIMESQSQITETAASAAKASADALVSTERAWIMLNDIEVDLAPSFVQLEPEQVEYNKITGVWITFTNHGKTPAWLTEFSIKFVIGDPNIALDHGPLLPLGGLPLPPAGWRRMRAALEPAVPDWAAVAGHGAAALLYGIVKYRDIFCQVSNKDVRETCFCLEYHIAKEADLIVQKRGIWLQSRRPEENRYT